ncbi:hypothetical protein JCM10908_000338 [Rhodotorula pacifica]|uniref:uncharacterized protein n=1 Tax=Rhodotorula pacifica TaxID=1495444 RepID=UPI003172F7CD
MTAYWVDYDLRNKQTGALWRLPLPLRIGFALVTLSTIIFLPESPYWLAARGRVEEARGVIHLLDSTPDEKARAISVDVQMNEILFAIEEERKTAKGFARATHQRHHLITYYAPVIFQQSAGMSHVDSDLHIL